MSTVVSNVTRSAPALALALLLSAPIPRAWTAEELPKIVRDQLDVVQPAIAKAQAEYARKVRDENAKLIVVIQKAMEKATKAGKLDDALALKSALEQAKSGELLQPFIEPTTGDLLGLAQADTGGMALVTLSIGNPVATLAPNKAAFDNRDYLFSEVAKDLMNLSFVQRSFKEPGACVVKVVAPGLLYVAVGTPSDGLDFAGLGFETTDLKIRSTAGEQSIVKKAVHAGEVITLAPSAIINSFPIWRAPSETK